MGTSGSNENKSFQIVMVLITSIVAPLVVFFITNTTKNSAAPTPTAVSGAALTATLPPDGQGSAATPAAPASDPMLQGIQNPTGLVPAGTPAIVDNLALSISAGDVQQSGNAIRLTLHIKNLGKDARSLTYVPAAVQVQDEKRAYPIQFGDKKSGCAKSALALNKQVTINPGAEITLTSASPDQVPAWCDAAQPAVLPLYMGPVSKGTTRLQIGIDGMGPFKGFAFDVPLKP